MDIASKLPGLLLAGAGVVLLALIGAIAVALIVWVIVIQIRKSKYEAFVRSHSIALRTLAEINSSYRFLTVESFSLAHSYDNADFYADISTADYLIYQLVYIAPKVEAAISAAAKNKSLFVEYTKSVRARCLLGRYDTEEVPQNEKLLKRTEEAIFKSMLLAPKTEFSIPVVLMQTNIRGAILTRKQNRYEAGQIKGFIQRLRQKRGSFYLDDEIWQAICRVERGRVSNKMRFSIYERDGYRCRKCGRKTDDLEIDHIFPVSKGGKSTYDNLQTLCHRCNVQKSNTVEAGCVIPSARANKAGFTCASCGAQMVLRNGKNGRFYGCPNYPKCKYTAPYSGGEK